MGDISIWMTASIAGGFGGFIDVTPWAPFAEAPDGTQSWITINETVGGIATCDIQIWDLENVITPIDFGEFKIVDNVAGRNLFWGLMLTRTAEPVAAYRIWKIHAVDWNWLLPLSLVGTPYVFSFMTGGDANSMIYVDPNASSGGTDSGTVQHLFGAYWLCGIFTPDTSTYVETINSNLGDPVYWDRTDLRSALNDTCALSGPYSQCWLDMDGYVHLTAFAPTPGPGNTTGQPLTLGNPVAVSNSYVSDIALVDSAPGAGELNYENFTVEWDLSGAAFSVYVRGATDTTWTTVWVPTPGVWNVTDFQIRGTGWVGVGGVDGGSSWVSRYLDAPGAVTHAQRNAAGGAALRSMFINNPLIRGQCDVVGTSIAFHAGQMQPISNTPTEFSGTYPIQQVTTTLVGGRDLRRCSLQWGTAQLGTLGLRASQPRNVTPVKGSNQFVVTADAYAAHTSQKILLTAQLINSSGDAWAIQGIATTWHVQVIDDTDTDVTATTSFTLTPLATSTDTTGQVQANLVLDSAATGVQYRVTVTGT